MSFTAAVQHVSTSFVTTRGWRGTFVVHVRRTVLRAHSDQSIMSSLGAGGARALASSVLPNTHLVLMGGVLLNIF